MYLDYDFDKYYNNFLDVSKAEKINNVNYIKTENRSKILNNEFLYPIIISRYKNELYVSILSKYYDIVLNYTKKIDLLNMNYNQITDVFREVFSNIKTDFEIKNMYRMFKYTKNYVEGNDCILLNDSTKEYFFKTGKKSNDILFKEKKWFQMKYIIDSKLIFIIPKNGKIVSMAYVSDVFYNGANIIVNTDKEYKNLNFGKSVVSRLVNEILNKDLLPIYFVNKSNVASIALAKGIGFNIKAEEVVISIHKDNI